MRRRFRMKWAFVFALLLPGVHRPAYADRIVFNITQRLTGQVNGADFNARLLTFQASVTTENLAACSAAGLCVLPFNGVDYYFLDYSANLQARWTVEGIGTFEGSPGANALEFFYLNNSGRVEDIVIERGGDYEGGLILPWPEIGDQCENSPPCPVVAYTSGGQISVTGIDGDPTFSARLESDVAAIPEPSSLVLAAMGTVSSALFALQRKRKKALI